MSAPPSLRRGRCASFLCLSLLLGAGCGAPPFVPAPFEPIAEPPAEDVTAVVFLVGDAGAATVEEAPLIHRLRRDVERWSGALARDSAVAVVFLGDNVYPEGLRPRSHPDFSEDSARLHAQIWIAEGPAALRYRTPGLFLAGNHDWGNMSGDEGVARVRHMADHLEAVSRTGPAVSMAPDVGSPGPEVVDVGPSVRLALLDTHWWLQAGADADRDAALHDVAAVLAGRGDRTVVLAAHHPFVSGGPHGGGCGLDVSWLLRKAGALVHDLNSAPFRRLREGLEDIFSRAGPPLVYAAATTTPSRCWREASPRPRGGAW